MLKMHSRAEQTNRRNAFEYLLDSKRDSFRARTYYFGLVNSNIIGVCWPGDDMMEDIYLHLENAIIDNFFGAK